MKILCDFLSCFETIDKTWKYQHDLKLEQERLQWTKTGCSYLKQMKSEWSTKKCYVSDVMYFIDLSPWNGEIIYFEYFHLLDQLNKKIRDKTPGLATQKNHQDNALSHERNLMMVKLNRLKYELLENSPYSPDLAPCDF